MSTAAEVVGRVCAIERPVIFVDACSLLDVVRDPTREKFSGGHLAAAQEVLVWAEGKPASVSVLLTEQAHREAMENVERVEREAAQALERLDGSIRKVAEIGRVLGLPDVREPTKFAEIGIGAAARRIFDRFLAAASIVDDEVASKARAMTRVSEGRAPASPGKQSAKDCLVIETCLYVARELRGAAFGGKMLFLTSNTTDYTSGPRGSLHQDLTGEFAAVQMDLAREFLAARYGL